MRSGVFLLVGLALLVVQANVFRVIDGVGPWSAAGLGVLARVAGYAKRSGRSLKLTAARPSLLRIMRITGMDEAFPEVRTPTLAMISWPRQASVATNN